MKKVLITMAVLTSMMACVMVFSSFVAPKEEVKSETSKTVMNDDGWEDWSVVSAHLYYKDDNGRWRINNWGAPTLEGLKVQRRAWCGETQYRINYRGSWYPVSKSPIDDYPYCFYEGTSAWCFRM